MAMAMALVLTMAIAMGMAMAKALTLLQLIVVSCAQCSISLDTGLKKENEKVCKIDTSVGCLRCQKIGLKRASVTF